MVVKNKFSYVKCWAAISAAKLRNPASQLYFWPYDNIKFYIGACKTEIHQEWSWFPLSVGYAWINNVLMYIFKELVPRYGSSIHWSHPLCIKQRFGNKAPCYGRLLNIERGQETTISHEMQSIIIILLEQGFWGTFASHELHISNLGITMGSLFMVCSCLIYTTSRSRWN